MKTKTLFIGVIVVSFLIFCFSSCTQKKAETELKIENTLKSVHFYSDSIGIEPQEFLLSMERVNKAIDSIGYPDAGYKVWLVQSDTNKTFRFMLEGYWPNQAIYDSIHNHELYKQATSIADKEELWNALKEVSYNKFTLVK
jgi:hypothetical protein